MLDKIKRAMGIKEKPVVKEKPKSKTKKTDKEIATAAGEPYVNIISMDIDPKQIKVDKELVSVEGVSDRWVSEDTDSYYYDINRED